MSVSIEDRCLGLSVDSGQARGIAVNNISGGDWYPESTAAFQPHDIQIIECFFYTNTSNPAFPLVPKIYAILNQFNGTIHSLSVRTAGQLEWVTTTANGGQTALGVNGAIANNLRWHHAVVTPSFINGVYNFYFAETGRHRDTLFHGPLPTFPGDYTLTQAMIASGGLLIGTRFGATSPARIGLMRFHSQGGGGTNSDLDGGVGEFRIWRNDPSISNFNDRINHIASVNGRHVTGEEFKFLAHCTRLNENASVVGDYVDVGVQGAVFSEFAIGTAHFDSHGFIDEAPAQIVDLTQLQTGTIFENVSQTVDFTQVLTEDLEIGEIISPPQLADFTQLIVDIRVHIPILSQTVDLTQIVLDGLVKDEVIATQTVDFTELVSTLRTLVDTLAQTVDLTEAVVEVLVRTEVVGQTVDFTEVVSLLVERNITQAPQIVDFVQAVVTSFVLQLSRTQTVDFTQVVISPVIRLESNAQTVDLTQVVVSPVTKLESTPGQTADFTQLLSLSATGIEQPAQILSLTQVLGLSVTRNRTFTQTVDFADLASMFNFDIVQVIDFLQGLTLLEITSQTADFTQVVAVSVLGGEVVSATVDFTQTVTVVKVFNPSLIQTVDLTQTLVKTGSIDLEISQTVEFTDEGREGTLTENVSQSIKFGQSVGASKDLETLSAAIAEDYLAFSLDAAEAIFYQQETQVGRTETGQRTVSGPIATKDVPYAMRRQASNEEIHSFGGKIRVGDVSWELPKNLMDDLIPEEGDTITSKDLNGVDEIWRVVAVDVSTLKTRYRAYGRKVR